MKRWFALMVVIALIGALWLISVRGLGGGPIYQGRSLSRWLDDYGRTPIGGGLIHDKFKSDNRRGPQRVAPAPAIQAMGTNCIEFLLSEIKRKDDPAWLARIRPLLRNVPWIENRLPDAQSRREQAALAFFDLGTNSIAALPALAQLLTNYSSAACAAHALAGMGTNAVPAFTAALTNSSTWINDCGAWGLAQIGPESRVVVPQILPLFRSGNTADTMLVLWALSQIREPIDIIRPELVNHLGHADTGVRSAAIRSLQNLGSDAQPAVPEIKAALERESDQGNRESLEKLLKQLNQKTE